MKEYDKSVARYDYTEAYTGLYREAEAEGWSLGGGALGDSIAAAGALSGDLR